MATGYSIFNTELNINGTAIAKQSKPVIEIPPVGEDENGVNRFTSSTEFKSPITNTEAFRVVQETVDGNTITTNLQVMNLRWGLTYLETDANITLKIYNNSGYEFQNGEIKLIESNNTQPFQTAETACSLNITTVENGGFATATIAGRMRVRYVTSGTFFKYQISFDVNGKKEYFYYILNMIPKE